MGGRGSGRPRRYHNKTTVEACVVLKARDFKDVIMAGLGSYQSAPIWGGFAHFTVEENAGGPGERLRLVYTLKSGDESKAVDYHVQMFKTEPHFGGVRYYFLCPLAAGGRPCHNRASKLYLPPGGLYFGCRECYGLTYTSSQESHKLDGFYKAIAADMGGRITPRAVKRLLKAPR